MFSVRDPLHLPEYWEEQPDCRTVWAAACSYAKDHDSLNPEYAYYALSGEFLLLVRDDDGVVTPVICAGELEARYWARIAGPCDVPQG